jgi:hypothetical protein
MKYLLSNPCTSCLNDSPQARPLQLEGIRSCTSSKEPLRLPLQPYNPLLTVFRNDLLVMSELLNSL